MIYRWLDVINDWIYDIWWLDMKDDLGLWIGEGYIWYIDVRCDEWVFRYDGSLSLILDYGSI